MPASFTQPGVFRPIDVHITPASWCSIGLSHRAFSTSNPASAAWPAADLSMYIPFIIPKGSRFQILTCFCANGTTAAGTVDIGVYDDAWARILSTGPTTQTGTAVIQDIGVTDTWLAAGRYYLGICCSDVTSTLIAIASGLAPAGAALGFAQQTSTPSSTLPATATPALFAQTLIPVSFGLAGRAV